MLSHSIERYIIDETVIADIRYHPFISNPVRSPAYSFHIWIIEFSDKIRVLLPLTPVTSRASFLNAFQQLSENGMTDIDGSLRAALTVLKADSGSNRRVRHRRRDDAAVDQGVVAVLDDEGDGPR